MASGPIQLVGPTYNLDSRPSSVQRTVNLIPIPQEPGNERTGWVFKDAPGLGLFVNSAVDPLADFVVALFHFESDFFDSSRFHSTYTPTLDNLGVATTPQTTSSVAKFGASSMDLSGGANPKVPGIQATAAQFTWSDDSQAMTFEHWIYWDGTQILSGQNFNICNFLTSSEAFTWQAVLSPAPGVGTALRFNRPGFGTPEYGPALGVGWNYFAVQRHGEGIDGFTLYLALPGATMATQVGTYDSPDGFHASHPATLTVGGLVSFATNTHVKLDEFRLTFARRFAPRALSIVVPTEAFSDP